jgi:hypothetical protein
MLVQRAKLRCGQLMGTLGMSLPSDAAAKTSRLLSAEDWRQRR